MWVNLNIMLLIKRYVCWSLIRFYVTNFKDLYLSFDVKYVNLLNKIIIIIIKPYHGESSYNQKSLLCSKYKTF